ncbi:MAG: alpha/beta hydrolase [Burkholderiales bacterium]
MSGAVERVLIPGAAGEIETVLDLPPNAAPRGVALVAHPHPLYGGALDNKVAQTLAWAFRDLGYVAVRPNFRGVGQSQGEHDKGIGETDDLQKIAAWAAQRFGNRKTVLAGFSFGSYVQIRLAQRIEVERMVLVGTAVGRVSGDREYAAANVPEDTILIHGELDETVPLVNVLAWAAPQDIPVVVIPGADHFFHRRLNVIRGIVKRAWPS